MKTGLTKNKKGGGNSNMKYLFKKEQLKFGFNMSQYVFRIGEIESMSGISARQLRYWESKGIIMPLEREDEQSGRIYPFKMFIRIMMIKTYLDQGNTLKNAVIRVDETQNFMRPTHDILSSAFHGLVYEEDMVYIDLGDFDTDGNQRLLAYQKKSGENQKVSYRIVDKEDLEESDE